MGALVNMSVTNFKIKKANLENAFVAVRQLPRGAWVDESLNLERASLFEVLIAWRWQPEFDESGDLIGLHFLGEKVGSDEDFFSAIAPYVEPGAIVKISSDFGREFLKFAVDGIRRGSPEKVQYSVRNLFIPASQLAAATSAIRRIQPDFWFDDNLDVQRLNFDAIMRAWRWVPNYDDDGNVVGLTYNGSGTGSETSVIEALAEFVNEGATVDSSTSLYDFRWTFARKKIVRETLKYKGP